MSETQELLESMAEVKAMLKGIHERLDKLNGSVATVTKQANEQGTAITLIQAARAAGTCINGETLKLIDKRLLLIEKEIERNQAGHRRWLDWIIPTVGSPIVLAIIYVIAQELVKGI